VAPGADGEKVKTPDKLIIHQIGGRTMEFQNLQFKLKESWISRTKNY